MRWFGSITWMGCLLAFSACEVEPVAQQLPGPQPEHGMANEAPGPGTWQTSSSTDLPHLAPCGLQQEVWQQAVIAADMTADSMHELVVCGGAQVRLAQTLMAAVLLSSREAFDMTDETFAKVQAGLDSIGVPKPGALARTSDGGWTVMQDPKQGLDFTVWFYQPGTRTKLTADPFQLESYLVGAKVTSSLTLDQMMASWSKKCVYTFTYDELGPLGHLLNGGQPVPNPFQIELSFWDFVRMAMGEGKGMSSKFGPIGALSDVAMTSKVVLDDLGREVRYVMDGKRAALATLADNGLVSFGLVSLQASWEGQPVLIAKEADLTVLPKGLAGTLRQRLGDQVEILHDFGKGANYPKLSFGCLSR